MQKFQRVSGWLLVGSVALMLLLQLYLLSLISRELGFLDKTIFYVFGSWLLIMIKGYFQPIVFLWVPWSAIVLGFLLWAGRKIIRGDISERLALITSILGFWMLLTFVLERAGFGYYGFSYSDIARGSNIYLLFDIVTLLCIIAIGMFAFTRYRHLLATLLPQAEKSDEIQEKKPDSRGAFFSFRIMLSRTIIKVLYFLGMLSLTIGGLAGLFSGDDEGAIIGLLALTAGNLLWRLMCEGWILFFSIHDILASIETKLDTSRTT